MTARGPCDTFTALARPVLDELLERRPGVLPPRSATTASTTGCGDRSPRPRSTTRHAGWATAGRRAGRGRRRRARPGRAGRRRDPAPTASSCAAFELDELREHEWDPLSANPGTAIYPLLAREFAPLGRPAAAVAGRLAAVPGALAGRAGRPWTTCRGCTSRPRSASSPAPARCSATELERAARRGARPRVPRWSRPAERALAALDEHLAWLPTGCSDTADGDPRLGPELLTPASWPDPGHRRRPGRAAGPRRGRARGDRGADRRGRGAARRRPAGDGQVRARARRAGRRRVGRRRHDRRAAAERRAGADDRRSSASTTWSPCTTTRSRSS